MLIVNGWFVGKLGTIELATLAPVFPAQTTLQMMSAGFTVAGGILTCSLLLALSTTRIAWRR